MPPINPMQSLRTIRPRQLRASNSVIGVKRPAVWRRSFADNAKAMNNPDKLPSAEGQEQVGPNMQQQEHVSEEAAKMAKMTGGKGPDIEGQGTPVQEILAKDDEARKNAPKVMKESIQSGQGAANAKPSTNARSFSTLARRMQDMNLDAPAPSDFDPAMIPSGEQRAQYADALTPVGQTAVGHKFPLPELPVPYKEKRYDSVVDQVTNLLMQDGKKATAQRNMAYILNVLRTNSAPTYPATRPLLPGAPPASHLPLNPILYLTLAIDSVAPLLRIRSQRGAAGGGVALQIPVPLGLRQRRRTAVTWILDAASKRKSRGSGKNMFAQKVADELIAVVEGRSAIWTKRDAIHRLATTARSNLTYGSRGGRR